MIKANLTQIFICILALLSLFSASVSACTCTHHPSETNAESFSYHKHSSEIKTEDHQSTNHFNNLQTRISEPECSCIQSAQEVSAKVETNKIKKQTAVTLPVVVGSILSYQPEISVKFEFIKPAYLSDSFYNLTPGRAPPRI